MSNVTPRETEVIRWMAAGKTAAEIGTILGISHITVNTHIANAKARLGVFKDTALVAAALRNGIIR
ncbi:response regulator transcription factor [Rhizobium johnstonii]|jgi:DNA-binding CsgD family transcriptional regulator|nr:MULTISPECIES: helix-turn-helix domain-containing protein [Rhizobium]EJC69897.1 response regulator containing a CheY-like receiver domain and an HTH DNA-binding domain [Rhizobium leguminosarum bv. viciae WSM1455]QJS26499.1 helix-turn-helix domain-containing protein [Rhizobium leguminosarum bv. trifolii TA1]AOO93536.1 LuxR family transcriptional regulator [Rhizobium leguminosarum bv. trifolii]AXA41666.1 luxR regulatory family protein [Rhizobium leguminosarum]KPN25919.1 LuxR family transcripti